jgi:hypothetical protein
VILHRGQHESTKGFRYPPPRSAIDPFFENAIESDRGRSVLPTHGWLPRV